jgi:hypothetical protein
MVMRWLKVNVPVTDIWSRSAFESSRTNQAIFGQILRSQRLYRNHHLIYTEDNYRGWVRDSHVIQIDCRVVVKKQAKVQVPLAEIFTNSGGLTIDSRLSYGAVIEYESRQGDWIRLISPHGWIKKQNLLFAPAAKTSRSKIIKTLKAFLGIPYLWGGCSGFGLDCSGLVQLVYNFHGLSLPRDTKDQIKCGRRVSRKALRAGDLIFSPGHVSVSLGHGKIIHSSLKAGGVKIESLEKSSQAYRKDISENIIQIRRVL